MFAGVSIPRLNFRVEFLTSSRRQPGTTVSFGDAYQIERSNIPTERFVLCERSRVVISFTSSNVCTDGIYVAVKGARKKELGGTHDVRFTLIKIYMYMYICTYNQRYIIIISLII